MSVRRSKLRLSAVGVQDFAGGFMVSNTLTTLITGASGGIGYQLARRFARDHYDLVLVARSVEKLNQVAGELQSKFGVSVKVVALDLAASPAASLLLGQIQLNITVLTHLTRLFLPPMLARHSGKIMNVASTAAFQPGPLMAVYYATKAYVLSFSEALANEVA